MENGAAIFCETNNTIDQHNGLNQFQPTKWENRMFRYRMCVFRVSTQYHFYFYFLCCLVCFSRILLLLFSRCKFTQCEYIHRGKKNGKKKIENAESALVFVKIKDGGPLSGLSIDIVKNTIPFNEILFSIYVIYGIWKQCNKTHPYSLIELRLPKSKGKQTIFSSLFFFFIRFFMHTQLFFSLPFCPCWKTWKGRVFYSHLLCFDARSRYSNLFRFFFFFYFPH